jgi:hypothetical protein
MAEGIPARLTAAEGRTFGLTVGAAFLVFAGLSYWRGHAIAPPVLATLGGTLALLGLVIPARLGPVFSAWMRLAHAMSKVTTPLFMGIVYFAVLTPIGLVVRLLGRNPLSSPRNSGSGWVKHDSRSEAPDSMRRQF